MCSPIFPGPDSHRRTIRVAKSLRPLRLGNYCFGECKGRDPAACTLQKYYEDLEQLGCLLPDVADEIELIRMYGAETLAVTLNDEGGTHEELAEYRQRLSQQLQLPVVCPLHEGTEGLLPVIGEIISQHQ